MTASFRMLTIGLLLALSAAILPPTNAHTGVASCTLNQNNGTCSFVCHVDDIITVTVTKDPSAPLWVRGYAECGGVSANTDQCYSTCTATAGPVTAPDTGLCVQYGFGTVTCTASGGSERAGSDGIDNDGDGWVDGSDPQCSGPGDNDEGCVSADIVTSCLVVGGVFFTYTAHGVSVVDGPTQTDVDGYLDAYRFTLPGGIVTTIPCITLLVDGTEVNGCAQAGGAFVSREFTLVDATVGDKDVVDSGPVATIQACNANLALTVGPFGVESAPFLVPC